MEEIKELKLLCKAHDIADEYDVMTDESPDYTPEMEEYIGFHPYEIVNRIKRIIENFK